MKTTVTTRQPRSLLVPVAVAASDGRYVSVRAFEMNLPGLTTIYTAAQKAKTRTRDVIASRNSCEPWRKFGKTNAKRPMFTRVIVAISVVGSLAIIGVLLMSDLLLVDDRPSAQTLANGRAVYGEHCASCHGANLEGQPEWQTPRPSGRLPAPPRDASGHTWHHSDRILFEITKYGTAAIVGRGYESDMPGFGPVLNDSQIRAVLAFIKSTWPERERRYQQEMTRRDQAEQTARKDAASENRP